MFDKNAYKRLVPFLIGACFGTTTLAQLDPSSPSAVYVVVPAPSSDPHSGTTPPIDAGSVKSQQRDAAQAVHVIWNDDPLAGGSATTAGDPGSTQPVANDGSEVAETTKRLQSAEGSKALGNNLFGDSSDYYSGGVTFTNTDVDLPGNDALPMRVTRTRGTTKSEYFSGSFMFGDWDLDIPYVDGIYPMGNAWQVAGNAPAQRCTSSSQEPISVRGFTPIDYFRGNRIHLPGGGSALLSSALTKHPNDNQTNASVASNYMQVRCGVNLLNSGTTVNYTPYQGSDTYDGEGFLVLGTDGTKYTFAWMRTRMVTASTYISGYNSAGKPVYATLQRVETRIYPTRVEDRFGNYVTYDWNDDGLQDMVASDGRRINFAYATYGSGSYVYRLVNTVTVSNASAGAASTRTWNYAYNGGLSSVTLPDGTAWQYSFPTFNINYSVRPGQGAKCNMPAAWDPTVQTQTATITHPSGAQGTFAFTLTRFGRTEVDNNCPAESDNVNPMGHHQYGPPLATDRYALTSKTISGAGISNATWQMGYEAPNFSDQSGFGNGGSGRRVTVTVPNGSMLRYSYGNQWDYDEGKLYRTETLRSDGTLIQDATNNYIFDPSSEPSGTAPYTFDILYGSAYLNDNYAERYNIPRKKTISTLDSTAFTNQVTQFDDMARVVTTSRSGPSGSRTDTTTYYDNTTHWVLGQVGAKYNNDTQRYEEQTTFDPVSDKPASLYRFGLLISSRRYNADGTTFSVADGLNRPTTFAPAGASPTAAPATASSPNPYWYRGTPKTVTFADNSTKSFSADDYGEVTATTDELGNKTSYAYDAAGRVSGITYPTGDQAWDPVSITYAQLASADSTLNLPAGVWKMQRTEGKLQKTLYLDTRYQPILQVEADTSSGDTRYVRKAYDTSGHPTFTSYPASTPNPTTGIYTAYDALDRETTETTDAGTVLSSKAYLANDTVQVTDAKSNSTTTQYQAYDSPATDNPLVITAPEHQTTTYSRDLFGHILTATRTDTSLGTSVTEANGYDDAYRLCRVHRPESNQHLIHYDAASQVDWSAEGITGAGTTSTVGTASCGYAAATAAQQVTNHYTLRGWVDKVTYGDGTTPNVTTGYAADGKPLSVVNSSATWIYTYNSRRLMTGQQVSTPDSAASTHTLHYDSLGHVSDEIFLQGSTVYYAPDAWGAPTQMTSNRAAGNASWLTHATRWPNGQLKSATLGNGLYLATTLDARQRVASQTVGTSAGSGQIQSLAYGYDDNSQLTAVTDNATASPNGSDTATYGYDGLHRLTSATSNTMWGTYGYTYDGVGNLRTRSGPNALSYAYNGNNQLSAVSGGVARTYAYDPVNPGRVSADGRYTYTWNQAGQLVSVALQSNGAVVATYTYDGNGHRVNIKRTGEWQEYTLHDPAGRLLGTYKYPYATIYPDFDGKPLMEHREDGTVASFGDTYLHADWQGSARVATNASGAVLWREHYDPYGKRLTNAAVEKRGYTGHSYDPETANTYMLARYYDADVGRFLMTDPIGSKDNLNLYAYVHGDPIGNIDPTGTCTGSNLTIKGSGGLCSSTGGYSTSLTGAAEGIQIGRLLSSVIAATNAVATTASVAATTAMIKGDTEDQNVMYHGTSVSSAVAILNGASLSADIANREHMDGEVGFYLTPNPAAAEYYALRRSGGILQFTFSNEAISALNAAGARMQSMPPIGYGSVKFLEYYIPPNAFPLFDGLRQTGNITVMPYRP